MIVTLTANPSLDRTVGLADPLVRGAVLRTTGTRTDPGGKGVNVARVVAAAGTPVRAVLPADPDDPLLVALVEVGVPFDAEPLGAPVRSNITIAEDDGTTTKLNAPGPALGPDVADRLLGAVVAAARDADWVVLSGSLPPGPSADWYVAATAQLRERTRARIAVDTSDAPLLALAEGLDRAAPDLVKPNADELAQLTGSSARALEDASAAGDLGPIVDAARILVHRGIGTVLATLGASGAVLVDATGAWFAAPPPVRARSTVGAGDSSLAGYLLADLDGLAAPERLARAVAYGSAAVALPGTALPRPVDLTGPRPDVRALDTTPVGPPPAGSTTRPSDLQP